MISSAGVVYEVSFPDTLSSGEEFKVKFSDVEAGATIQVEYFLGPGSQPTVEKFVDEASTGFLSPVMGTPWQEPTDAWSWDGTTGVLSLLVVQEGIEDDFEIRRP